MFVPVASLNSKVAAGKFVVAPGIVERLNVNVSSTRPFVAIAFVQIIEELPNVPSVLKTAIPDGNGCVTVAKRGMAKGFATQICA